MFFHEASTSLSEATPRDQMPTLPCDLSEYARSATGPQSWTADADASADDPFDRLFAGLEAPVPTAGE